MSDRQTNTSRVRTSTSWPLLGFETKNGFICGARELRAGTRTFRRPAPRRMPGEGS